MPTPSALECSEPLDPNFKAAGIVHFRLIKFQQDHVIKGILFNAAAYSLQAYNSNEGVRGVLGFRKTH
jgi:hypothetical protein